MPRIRFSIGQLMAVVLVGAIGLGALRNPSMTWATIIDLATRVMLGLAILGVSLRRGAQRAWWLGFAVFGGA